MKKELQVVRDKIEYEGFEYCFINYSSWDDIKDKKFQKLKKSFVTAYHKLNDYVMDNTDDEYEGEIDED